MQNIVIGVSLKDEILAEIWGHWMDRRSILQDVPVLYTIGPWISHNRNVIVTRAFNEVPYFDRLLFLDADILFPETLLDRVQQHVQPVVGGAYFGRGKRKDLIAYRDGSNGKGRLPYGYEEVTRMVDNPSLYAVNGLGMGCTSIARTVFEVLAENNEPWFDSRTSMGSMYSEDLWFCDRAREAGFPIYLDTSIVCEHLGVGYYTYASYREWARGSRLGVLNNVP